LPQASTLPPLVTQASRPEWRQRWARTGLRGLVLQVGAVDESAVGCVAQAWAR
jgi:hypothetical protein